MSKPNSSTKTSALIESCIEAIKLHTKHEEERLIIADAILKGVAGSTTHISKLKEIPELIACRHIGLNWNGKTMHGHDAVDSHGRPVELKTGIAGSKSRNININYSVKDTPELTLEHYKSDQFSGGHYWVGMNARKTEVRWYVYISQTRFLKLLREYSLTKPINFGSSLCKVCKRCKRIDECAGLKKCPH